MSSIDTPADVEGRRWGEMDRLFERALDLPGEEREAFVTAECGDDAELRAELRALLEAHEASTSFLSDPPLVLQGGLNALADEVDMPSARVGEQVGAWRVIGEIGRGGMATVYRVERVGREFEQEGALKLLRRGLDTEDLVRRFRAERQILSSLDHPNIAGLLDGGTTSDGRPYLVMACVDGVRITEWCDENHCTIDERLRLFLAVARAVHHAHGKLVVHRDLKPSNILVTSDGHVKLLDFGIAKLLDPDLVPDDAVRTRSGHRALTPEYASPEQLRGDPVTTATDIYQLGLLLHGLLSGARPRDLRSSGDDVATNGTATDSTLPGSPSRIVARTDTDVAAARNVSARRLEQRLRGDLDTIVLTALRPEADDRYGSALEMARDVESHLDGLPITARPPTVAYRTRKFLSRHRWVAPVGAAIVALVGLYVATLLRHGNQVEAERNAARQQAERAETVRDVLVDVFQGASPWLFEPLPRSGQATLLQSLDVGVERTRALGHEPDVQVDLFSVLAGAYLGLGHPDRARPLMREGLRLRAATDGPGSPSIAVGLRQLGRALAVQARYDSAASVLASSVALLRERPSAPDTMLLGTLIDLGWVEKLRGHPEVAERLLLEVVDTARDDPAIPRDLLV
ncbi:MAG: serine/threonine protein kinase, partial [Gemmatimonadota bacterium]